MTMLKTLIRILDSYPFQLLVCTYLLTVGFPHRKKFVLRVFLHAVPLLLIFDFGAQAFPNGLSPNPIIEKASLLMPVFYIFLGVLFCYDIKVTSALYCSACVLPVQNFMFNLYWIVKIYAGFTQGTVLSLCCSSILMLIVYSSAFLLFRLNRVITAERTDIRRRIVVVAVLVAVLVIFFDFRIDGSAFEVNVYISYLIADVFAVIIQYSIAKESELEKRNAVLDDLLQSERKKHKMTAENIELINRKCHDLKHQIAGIRRVEDERERNTYIREIENAVMFYESAVKTGDETLDLILMEKLLYCQEHRIKLTCISDGEKLSFLDTMDIYSLFGNAIDNAIESVSAETEEQNRIISLRVGTRGRLMNIHIENYYSHELQLHNGLPVTTKKDNDYHGFGILSIRRTVEKYNGVMSIRTDNHLFRLDIMIPLNE